MDASVIRARLSLLIRLVDTSTGAEVPESSVQFLADGKVVRPSPRGVGNYVFVNTVQEDFDLIVRAPGYEEAHQRVCYQELDDNIPTVELFLIPSEKNNTGVVVTLSGSLPSLEAVEAVDLFRPVCHISSYAEKTREMTVIRQGGRRLDLSYGHYGLLQADSLGYEKLIVSRTDGAQTVTLKEPLTKPFTVNAQVMRVIYGSVDAQGNYLLRVRNDSRRLVFLVRYIVKGEERFAQVDFNDPETCRLT